MTHLLRLNTPKRWPIRRKGIKYIARPVPGPHKLKECITLNIVLKDLLKYAKTTREVKKILNEGKVLIDNVARKEHRFPIGIMDIIEIPTTNEHYVVMLDENHKFILKKIKKDEASKKVCKIIGKKHLKGNRLQLNLYDGKNALVDNDTFKIGDSVVYDFSNKKIQDHLKFEKGAFVYLADGKHVGKKGVVEDIKTSPNKKTRIVLKHKDKRFETLKDYSYVIKNERDND